MNLSELLNPERVRHNIEAGSKKAALENLSGLLAHNCPSVTAQEIFNTLINREKLGSTGLGKGAAIPHGRLGNLEKPVAAVLHLKEAVDFDAPDRQPVNLIFGLLVPEESTDEHLQILAGIAELLSQEGFVEALAGSASAADLLQLLARGPNND